MKYYLIVLFGAMCIAQWYVPVSMILEQEDILSNGAVYRFKTAPVDPNDPFRGKYITLNFDAETYKNPNGREWDGDQKVYVILEKDKDGFAAISEITDVQPGMDVDFFPARVRYANEEEVELQFPFDRFYLEESKAKPAEETYAESNTPNEDGSVKIAHAVVRIKNGKAALEDVRIDDRSIVDIVGERQENESE